MITELQRQQRRRNQTESEIEKPHISNSQLEMYWRCPEQYRRRYIEHDIVPPGVAMIQGKAVHAGAEFNFRQKIKSRADLPQTEIVDATVAAFETELAGGYTLDNDEMGRGASTVLGEAKDMTRLLGELHAKEQAPDYQPVVVEHTTRILLKEATHDLLTITDLVDEQNRVTDIKTANRAMPESAVHGSTQLTIYSAARCFETGQLPSEVRFDNLIKNKKPKRQVLRSTRTPGDLRVLANRINVTLAAVNAGMFTPCPTGSWWCSPKWCGYFLSGCPYVNAERLSAAETGE